jgi:hypothetical protein
MARGSPMGESTKAVLSLLVVIGLFGSWYLWTPDGRKSHPEHIVLLRAGLPLLGLAALSILLWAVFRRDKVPDQLRKISRSHLECDGLSFVVVPEVIGGVCHMRIHYQNRYERLCKTRLLIRPAIRHFIGIMRPRDLRPMEVLIECHGAGCGSTTLPYAVPADRQGKKVRFNVGGATKYPQGRGELLRFREAAARVLPPKGIADFVVTGLGALAGQIHIYEEASITMVLPKNVAEEIPTPQNQA